MCSCVHVEVVLQIVRKKSTWTCAKPSIKRARVAKLSTLEWMGVDTYLVQLINNISLMY